MKIHILDVLELKEREKIRPSVCLSVCLYVSSVDAITFKGVTGYKKNLVGIFYV